MGIDTVVLLRGTELVLPSHLHVVRLEDSVLVHTGIRFGEEPGMLAMGLRMSLGEALAAQDDPRGLFVLPDVAELRARTYEAVIAEVGEAGEWVPQGAPEVMPRFAAGGGFAGIMAEMLQVLGEGTLVEVTQALACGDPQALERAQARLVEALGGAERVDALGRRIMHAMQAEPEEGEPAWDPQEAMEGLPLDLGAIDLESPEIKAMMRRTQGDLEADPERREALGRARRGSGVEEDDED